MLSKIKRQITYQLASLLAGIATLIVIGTASIAYIHQPEVPDELL